MMPRLLNRLPVRNLLFAALLGFILMSHYKLAVYIIQSDNEDSIRKHFTSLTQSKGIGRTSAEHQIATMNDNSSADLTDVTSSIPAQALLQKRVGLASGSERKSEGADTSYVYEVPITGEERARLVRDRCREIYGTGATPTNPKYQFEYRTFLARDEKLMYCAIAKAFSSNIKRIMVHISDPHNTAADLNRDPEPLYNIVYPHQKNFWHSKTILYQVDEEERDMILQDYYKFVIVRDPLDKAISAYRDKFFSKTEDKFHVYFRKSTAAVMCRSIENILKEHGDEVSPYLKESEFSCNESESHISLQAFLAWNFLVPSEWKNAVDVANNPHWSLSTPICRMCDTNVWYDFVGHFENGNVDIGEIMGRAGWEFPFPNISDTKITDQEKDKFRAEVSNLSENFVAELNDSIRLERYILGYTNHL